MKISFANSLTTFSGFVVCRVIITESAGAPFNLSYLESFTNSSFASSNPLTATVPPYEPATNELWEEAVCRGTKLVNEMRGSDLEAAKLFNRPGNTIDSVFRDFPAEFIKWGYTQKRVTNPDLKGKNEIYLEMDKTWGVGTALRALRVSDTAVEKGGKIDCQMLTHGQSWLNAPNIDEQTYVVNGRTYRATNAIYVYAVSPEDGIIIGMNREGPKHAGQERRPKVLRDGLPELHQSSDAAWGIWKQAAGTARVQNVRYFISVSITNTETRSLIMRALGTVGSEEQLKFWPGTKFSALTPAGAALIGSPNGNGIAHMLVQHKREVDRKWIHIIRAFRCEDRYHPDNVKFCLLFEIEKTPTSPMPPQPISTLSSSASSRIPPPLSPRPSPSNDVPLMTTSTLTPNMPPLVPSKPSSLMGNPLSTSTTDSRPSVPSKPSSLGGSTLTMS